MSVKRVANDGATEAARRAAEEAARRAAEEAARRAAEEARKAAEAARQAAEAARQAQEAQKNESTFEPEGPKNTLKLDGQSRAPATSLLTENTQDGKVNCLDLAADFVNKSSPELQGRSDLVFLKDSRAGAEGQAGHVVVRQGERVLDPSNGKSYEDMKSYLKEQPHYSEAGSIPGTAAAKVFAAPPGSAERAQALTDAKVPPELQKMMVADPAIPSTAPNAAATQAGALPLPPVTVPVGNAGQVTVEFTSELDKKVKKSGGYTTVTLSAEMAASAKGELDMKKVTVGAGVSGANTQTYEVKMKDADFEKLKQGKIPPPHPLKPETIPNDASVKMDAGQLKGFSYEGSVDVKGVDFGLGEEIKKGRGVSFETQKDAEGKVTVTAGPTELIESGASVSVGAGEVSLSLNGSTSLTDYKMRTATFDVNTAEGRKAFEQFAKTKQLPTKDGSGVEESATVHKLELSSGSKVGLDAGPFSKEWTAVPEHGGSITVATKGDGSRVSTLEQEASDGTTTVYERHTRPDGTEDYDKQKFSLYMKGMSGDEEYTLSQAFKVDEADFNKKKDMLLQFTPADLNALAQNARDTIAKKQSVGAWGPGNKDSFMEELATKKNPAEVADFLLIRSKNRGQFAEDMAGLQGQFRALSEAPLPGTVTARHRDA
ncbi:hypothetical protein [Myxococcus sp. Y35]|uniref:hypothetical protein n=1 Tax=Pseudomyxococcus flavus TaxID=3115648 RepID=UPI003CF010A6